MHPESLFEALVVEKNGEGAFRRVIRRRNIGDLPEGELLVRVHYSSLNYKDALCALGRPGVTRNYPRTPGIDAAGEVVSCSDGAFSAGEKVVVTGYDLGMETDGGFGQYVRVPSSWALRVPEGLTEREAMIIGTAGLTAGIALYQLARHGVTPEQGEILVTGATGGVGSVAVNILAKAGYGVVAVTGKSSQEGYLHDLGARRVMSREELLRNSERPLLKESWAGVVDVAGGGILAAAIKSTRYGGAVAACGLAGSAELPLNVYPFILRAVSLIGIESSHCPVGIRKEVWRRLATDLRPDAIFPSAVEVPLAGLEEKFPAILRGELRGRTVVKLP